jgi:flagellar L-ring protein precursor FlgH
MMMSHWTFLRTVFLIALLSATAGCASKKARVSDPTELKAYVENANRTRREVRTEEGSLWLGSGYRSDLFSDPKARYIDDVLTIRVSESTQAVSKADAKNTKSTQMTAGFDKLFGAEKRISELPTLVSGKSDSSFQGQGSTSRATTLATSLTARVIDVLPNGYLVVEGMREIHVNNENQTIYLTGVVRPEDVGPSNIVLSSRVAQMQVRVQGKGVVSQPIKPGWLYRILNGILPF